MMIEGPWTWRRLLRYSTTVMSLLAFFGGLIVVAYGLDLTIKHRSDMDRTSVTSDMSFVSAGTTFVLVGLTNWYARELWIARLQEDNRRIIDHVYNPLIRYVEQTREKIRNLELGYKRNLEDAVSSEYLWRVGTRIRREHEKVAESYSSLFELWQKAKKCFNEQITLYVGEKGAVRIIPRSGDVDTVTLFQSFDIYAGGHVDNLEKAFLENRDLTDQEIASFLGQRYLDSTRGELLSEIFVRREPSQVLTEVLAYCKTGECAKVFYEAVMESTKKCNELIGLLSTKRKEKAVESGLESA